jgi:hypothetical protein
MLKKEGAESAFLSATSFHFPLAGLPFQNLTARGDEEIRKTQCGERGESTGQ